MRAREICEGSAFPRAALKRNPRVEGLRLLDGEQTIVLVDTGSGASRLLVERLVAVYAERRSSKQRARELYPELEKSEAQMRAYRQLPDGELFSEQWVRVPLFPSEFPGYKGERLACACCGEGINFDRFVERDGERLCLACANPSSLYYQPL